MTIFSYVVLIQGSELYINIALQKINVTCQVLIALEDYEIIKDHFYGVILNSQIQMTFQVKYLSLNYGSL